MFKNSLFLIAWPIRSQGTFSLPPENIRKPYGNEWVKKYVNALGASFITNARPYSWGSHLCKRIQNSYILLYNYCEYQKYFCEIEENGNSLFLFHCLFPLEYAFTYSVFWHSEKSNFNRKYLLELSKVHQKNISSERALNFEESKRFYKTNSRFWLWPVCNITENSCCLRLFVDFIQTQKRYPISLNKISIRSWKVLVISRQNFSCELNRLRSFFLRNISCLSQWLNVYFECRDLLFCTNLLLIHFQLQQRQYPCWLCHYLDNFVRQVDITAVVQENKASQIFRKTNISYPLIWVSGSKKCLFFGNLVCCAFLKHPFWDSSFCLIIDDTTTVKAKVLVVWICRANSDVGKVIITLKYQFPFARFWSRTTIFE